MLQSSSVPVCTELPFTFGAESRQLITEAFSSSCGHDQEQIPARQGQVDGPELQRSEPRQMKRVPQMLRDLFGPGKIYQTRVKQRDFRGLSCRELSTQLRVYGTGAIKALQLLLAQYWFGSG